MVKNELQKLGWLFTPNDDGFIFVDDERVISIHKNHLRIWHEFGDAVKLSHDEIIALAEFLKSLKGIQ